VHKLFVSADVLTRNKVLVSLFIVLSLLFFLMSIDAAKAQQQQQPQQTSQGAPLAIIPCLTQNILAIVSFLIETSSFILGLRIQSAAEQQHQQNRHQRYHHR
jgi:hypothetical protein